ncbi:kinesin-like protein Klp61F [Hetaerina americana]|uniref:kinesin-like protein Klp61F n=1 Tax=Hetaerina americana TaxID=62018 RepID=UPI003A7F31CD
MSKMEVKKRKPQKGTNQNIQVFVRVKPDDRHEHGRSYLNVVECPSSKEIVVRERPAFATTKTFSFDHVFDAKSSQIDVYRRVVDPLMEEVLAGYNCTVFAYGQTGTGKTYTMEGERSANASISWENDPTAGIIPRTLSNLFDELRQQDVEFTVRVSFLELYNEELIDLLAPATDSMKLRIFEDSAKKGSVIIQGLQEITVHDKNDVYHILMKGSERRQTAATLMNASSSRSHTIFSITVHIKENLVDGDELLKTGKLNLVDLAGSENIGRSGAVEKRAREAGNINQSLLTLGRVITALVERAPHVPYRESKLTRLLQDSLGGRTKTCFIATISPSLSNVEESLSTLDYAYRARDIMNRPEINQKLTKRELLKEYTEEIERLRKDLAATQEKNGIYMDHEEYLKLNTKVSALERENSEKYAHIKALQEEMEKMEELCSTLNLEINEKQSELIQKTEVLVDTEDCLEMTKSVLVSTELQKVLQEHLVNYHEDKQRLLNEQASTIMKAADVSSLDAARLHDKLSRKRSIEEGNKNRGEQFRDKFRRNVSHMEDSLEQMVLEHSQFCANLRTNLGDLQEQKTSELTVMSEHLTKQVQVFMDLLHGMEMMSADAMRNAQHWIQNHLGYVRSKDTSVEDLRASITELIEHPLQGISEQLRKAITDLQGLSNELNDKIRDRDYRMEVYSLEAKDALNGMEECLTNYVSQRKQESERIATIRRNMAEDSEAENMDMLSQLRLIKETVQRMEERVEAKQQKASESDELSDRLIHSDAVTENFAGEMHKTTGSLKKKLTKFVTAEKQTSENLQTTLRGFVEKRTAAISHMEHLRDETVAGCWSALSSHEEQRRQYYETTEEQLRDHSEMLKRYLQSEQEQTQALSTRVRDMAEVQESSLESGRSSFRKFMQQRRDELEAECSTVHERGQLLSDELKQRRMEVGHYFSHDYMEDSPTGETPPRRDYHYPRKLIVSSPREVVIKRFQAQLNQEDVLKSLEDRLHEKRALPKLSSSKSLPEIERESLLDQLPQHGLPARAKSNLPLEVDNSNLGDKLENQENLKITRKVKSRLKEPRVMAKLQAPLSEKNEG